jgi:hypothetical protein
MTEMKRNGVAKLCHANVIKRKMKEMNDVVQLLHSFQIFRTTVVGVQDPAAQWHLDFELLRQCPIPEQRDAPH